MLKHFFQSAWRHLQKERLYAFINVFGLMLGLSVVFFIVLYVSHEYSYNRSHEHRNISYRLLVHKGTVDWTEPLTPAPLGPAMLNEIPGIAEMTRVNTIRANVLTSGGDAVSGRVFSAEPGIFNILTIPVVLGDRERFLQSKNEAVISRRMADVLFGSENPLGKSFTLSGRMLDSDFTVTGIFDDLPENSTFRPEVLIHIGWSLDYYSTLYKNPDLENSWLSTIFQTYVRLDKGLDRELVTERLALLEKKYCDPEWKYSFGMQKVADIYLTSRDLANARTISGDPKKIRIFSLVGLLVLLIATFNYVILASARSAGRFREVGLRKVCGASRSGITGQVLGESLMTALAAFPLAVTLVALLLPVVNRILSSSLTFDPAVAGWIVPGFLGICLLVGVLSGLYLAFYLSRLEPVEIFRNRNSLGSSRSMLYKVLVTLQILIFATMLSSAGVIFKQIGFAQDIDPGFDQENLALISINQDQFPGYAAFADEIRKLTGVENAGCSMGGPPTESYGFTSIQHFSDPTKTVQVEGLVVGDQYLETMQFRLVSGRFFSPGNEEARANQAVINQRAITELGIEGDPIGQQIGNQTIIGVIEDIHVHSARTKINPLRITYGTKYCWEVAVRLKKDHDPQIFEDIEKVWQAMAPGVPFSHRYYDQALADLYSSTTDFAFTITGFSGLAILIAAMGLFGLSMLLAARRTREISIRKIHGASFLQIIMVVSRPFIWYTLVAWVISIPLTYWIMNQWLAAYAYRTRMGMLLFVVAGLVTLLIVLFTVLFNAWRTARVNPAEVMNLP